METPNSGSSTVVDTSTSLGDTSKLSFLDNLPADTSTETPETSTETAEVAEPEVIEEAPAPVTETGVLTANKGARDYSDIDPADVPLFKKMANDSFAKAKEWYLANRTSSNKYGELEGNYNKIKDQQFWSHPEAYRLSTEYGQASKELESAATISNYWTEALGAVRAGNPVKDLKMDANGNLTLGEELQPTPQLEASIMRTLAQTGATMQQAQQKLMGSKEAFGGKYKQLEVFLGDVESNLLGEVRKNEKFKELENGMLGLLPTELRSVKPYQLIAGMGAFIKALTGELGKLQAQVSGKKKVADAVRSNGPGEGKPAIGGASGGSIDAEIAGLMRHVGRV